MPWLIDLHCHTVEHSYDGKHRAADLVESTRAAGFHGMVFTDHNYNWPRHELAALREGLGLPEDFLLLSGQEVRTVRDGIVYGDILLYGVEENLPDGLDPSEVFAKAREVDGFCIAAHVGVPYQGFGERVGDYPFLAAEVWNGRYGNRVAAASRPLARKYGMIGVGGSDAHSAGEVAGGGTLFQSRPTTLADIAESIRNGEVEPWGMGLLGGILARLDNLRG